MHLRIIKQCDILEENNGSFERNQMKSELTNRFVFNPIPTDHPLTCLQTAQMIYFAYTRLNNTFRTAYGHWVLTVYSCLKSRLQKEAVCTSFASRSSLHKFCNKLLLNCYLDAFRANLLFFIIYFLL